MQINYKRQRKAWYRIGVRTGTKGQQAYVQQRTWGSYLFGWLQRDIGAKDVEHCDNRRRKAMADAMHHWVELKKALNVVRESENDHEQAIAYADGRVSSWEKQAYREKQPRMPDCTEDFEKFVKRIVREAANVFKSITHPPPPKGQARHETPAWADRGNFWLLDDPTKPLPSGQLMGDAVDFNVAWKLDKGSNQQRNQGKGSQRGGQRKGQHQDNS